MRDRKNKARAAIKEITYNIAMKIYDDKMKIGNNTLTSIDSTFSVVLKDLSDQVTVVDPPKKIEINQTHSNKIITRNFRKKLNGIDSISDTSTNYMPIDGRSEKTIAISHSKPIYRLADEAWRKCKSNHKQSGHKISVDDVVMAKVRGWSAWPAVVLEFVNKKRVKVEFFGVDQSQKFGFVDLVEVTRFRDSGEVALLLLKRDINQFKKAVIEAERFCGIPDSISLCKQNVHK